MDFLNDWVLTLITFTPIVAAVILLLLPPERKQLIKVIALVATAICLVLAIYVFVAYDQQAGATDPDMQFQFQQQFEWVPSTGISYHVGADGINLPMILLTGIVAFGGVMISWGIEDRTREFFAFFMLLVAGVFGVFVSLDLFLLFFFYELAIFPMYILIATWGSTRKEYAAMKLTLYLLIGSIVALVGILAIYFSANSTAMGLPEGQRTFDLLLLKNGDVPLEVARFWFLPIFIGFGVLAGIWPFHSWSPDGHVAAPTAVSMIHAGVLMKLGAYAALRVGVELLPQAAREQLPFVILLVLVNVVYGASIAMVQRDFKYVIGFSSVSHMGLVTMGFATLNQTGMNGAMLQMFSHGVMTALFFTIVGLVYDRAHTRDIPSLGGMAKVLPLAAVAFIIGGLVSMGMPGLSGFVAELQIFMGVWEARGIAAWYPWVALLSATGIIVTAAYVLRVTGQVFFGKYEAGKWHDMRPVNILDRTAMVMFCGIMIVVGVFPPILMNMIQAGTTPFIARLLGG
jgi:NADH-quinone oxidoreductase subunit M